MQPLLRAALAMLLAFCSGFAVAAPKRVVSMNACTDQMAMLIAGEGQLHSVSFLASDPLTSVLAAEAGRYPANHALAEEVFLMQPDLVVTGTYAHRATTDLLRQLGIRVEEFAPENSFADVRENYFRMGELLGRQEVAAALVADLDRQLAALQANRHPEISVASYYANSYTSGSGTLVDAVIKASGMTNLAAELGFFGLARLPLELLVLAHPGLLATDGSRYAAPALADESFVHPAYRALASRTGSAIVPGPYTLCGGPFNAEAARILQRAASGAGGNASQ